MHTVANDSPTLPAFLLPDSAVSVREVAIEAPSARGWSRSSRKRLLDLSAALLVLALSALPMLAIAICIRLSSKGPALFVQNRVGRGGRLFGIYKFRSMFVGASGSGLTAGGDRRITAIGRWMRKFKLDEVPQFYNILRGDMSLVGPRPKLPRYQAVSDVPYRPGITGAGTLAFRHEEEILRHIPPSQLDFFYDQQVKPVKAQIDASYMSQATFWTDVRLLAATVLASVSPEHIPGTFCNSLVQFQTLKPRRVAEGHTSKAPAASTSGSRAAIVCAATVAGCATGYDHAMGKPHGADA